MADLGVHPAGGLNGRAAVQRQVGNAGRGAGSVFVAAPVGKQSLKEALEGPERQIIRDVLEANGWNRNATADQLGINRTTLYKKMKRLGLENGHVTAVR